MHLEGVSKKFFSVCDGVKDTLGGTGSVSDLDISGYSRVDRAGKAVLFLLTSSAFVLLFVLAPLSFIVPKISLVLGLSVAISSIAISVGILARS